MGRGSGRVRWGVGRCVCVVCTSAASTAAAPFAAPTVACGEPRGATCSSLSGASHALPEASSAAHTSHAVASGSWRVHTAGRGRGVGAPDAAEVLTEGASASEEGALGNFLEVASESVTRSSRAAACTAPPTPLPPNPSLWAPLWLLARLLPPRASRRARGPNQ